MPVNMKALRKYARSGKTFNPPPVAEAPEPEVVVEPEPAPEPAPEPEPEVVVEPEPEIESPKWSMDNTKSELVAAAEEAGIEVKSTWNKADILDALLS